MSFFLQVPYNEVGKDYVVGDIHGCFDLLRGALNVVGFNEDTDRLFSVGDLVDRGPSSHEAIDWLDKPWFYAVRGNHEQMIIEAYLGLIDQATHCVNGGTWWYCLSANSRGAVARVLGDLPYAIEIETKNGQYGIIHAEVPGDDWRAFKEVLLEMDKGKDAPKNFEHMERFALWGRYIIKGRSEFHGVKNIDRVYVGHTPLKEWQIRDNVYYIDTGAVFKKHLTLFCITDDNVLQHYNN